MRSKNKNLNRQRPKVMLIIKQLRKKLNRLLKSLVQKQKMPRKNNKVKNKLLSPRRVRVKALKIKRRNQNQRNNRERRRLLLIKK